MGGYVLSGCDDDDVVVSQSNVQVGDTCPAFSVKDLTGEAHTFPVSGRPSVLLLFDTSCPDCVQQFPAVHELYKLYGASVEFLAVARDQDVGQVKQFIEAHQYAMPVAADGTRNVYELFAKSGVPRIYFMRNDKVMYMSDDSKLLSLDDGIGYVESLLRFYQ